MAAEVEDSLRMLGCEYIQEAGILLKLYAALPRRVAGDLRSYALV